MTRPRFELTISFPSWHLKNRDYFAFLHKSSGHRDTPHKTGTNPGKPGRMVTLYQRHLHVVLCLVLKRKFSRYLHICYAALGDAPNSASAEKMDESLFEQLLWQPTEEIDEEIPEAAPQPTAEDEVDNVKKEEQSSRKHLFSLLLL